MIDCKGKILKDCSRWGESSSSVAKKKKKKKKGKRRKINERVRPRESRETERREREILEGKIASLVPVVGSNCKSLHVVTKLNGGSLW
jgi:hypothetical protein